MGKHRLSPLLPHRGGCVFFTVRSITGSDIPGISPALQGAPVDEESIGPDSPLPALLKMG